MGHQNCRRGTAAKWLEGNTRERKGVSRTRPRRPGRSEQWGESGGRFQRPAYRQLAFCWSVRWNFCLAEKPPNQDVVPISIRISAFVLGESEKMFCPRRSRAPVCGFRANEMGRMLSLAPTRLT